MTPAELAAKANVAERYAREWLSHQAASGYLEYEPATGKFTLPPEQAMVFAEPDSAVYIQAAFDMAAVMLENQPQVEPRSAQERASARAISRRACSAPPDASFARATKTILSVRGCRRGRRRREARKRRGGR